MNLPNTEKHGRLFGRMIRSKLLPMNYIGSKFRRPESYISVFVFFSLLISVPVLASHGVYAQNGSNDAEDPVNLFNKGQDVHEKGDLNSAIDYYQRALKLNPAFPEAAFQIGVAYQAMGNIPEAESYYQKAVDLRPDWTLALTALGSILSDRGEYQKAEAFLSKALELDEQNFPALAALAEVRLKSNSSPTELSELLVKIEAQTKKANPTAALWSARAALENALGKSDSARLSIAKAIAIDPKNRYALESSAVIAMADGDLVRANEAVLELEKIAPRSPGTKLMRARVLASEGKAAESLKILDSIGNDLAGVRQLRSRIAMGTSENVPELEAALKSDPKNATVLGRLCSVYRVSSPGKALEYCRLASEADPTNIDHAIGFGAALLQANQYEQAVQFFRKLIVLAPDNSSAHADLATALFQLKRYPEAKAEFHWLTAQQPNLVVAYYFLGIIHDQLAEYMDAMANYQQFLRLADPEKNKIEIEKVNLRLPILQRQIRAKKGK